VFQTDLILWLQAFASDWLTTFMRLVSEIGAGGVYRAALIAIVFGVELRAGLLLLNLVFWSYLLGGVFKLVFALPRPPLVDPRVQDLGAAVPDPAACPGPGPSDFWSPLGPDVLACCRALPRLSFGFPSAHLTGTTSFYEGSALLLRHRGLALLGVAMVPLMGVSRLYLGSHFLADTVGGVVVGAIGIGSAAALRSRPRVGAAILLGSALAVLLAQPPLALGAGRLAGAVASTLFLLWRGLPFEGGSLRVRLARVGLAYGLYFGSLDLVPAIAVKGGFAGSTWVDFATGALPISLCLVGTVWLGVRLRLFGPASAHPAAPTALP